MLPPKLPFKSLSHPLIHLLNTPSLPTHQHHINPRSQLDHQHSLNPLILPTHPLNPRPSPTLSTHSIAGHHAPLVGCQTVRDSPEIITGDLSSLLLHKPPYQTL